ncbi:hypothetical protein AVEN_174610-1 [Araneus ventricosus]|uniref:Uncharacterized protein n=1 Tax=Araneus ventricosus TaxID=182803 RepID=A0A4Y2RYQ5_ARAVE|nr:hypothetical protein AVEN_174610-1 [Araneus ventricosus]
MLLIIFHLVCPPVNGELYSALAGMETLLDTQKVIVDTLNGYIETTERKLDKIKNFGKRKYSLGHREVIRRTRSGMLSDGVILLHGNTHTVHKTKNCCESSSGKSGAIPLQPRFGSQPGFQTLIWNKVLLRQ